MNTTVCCMCHGNSFLAVESIRAKTTATLQTPLPPSMQPILSYSDVLQLRDSHECIWSNFWNNLQRAVCRRRSHQVVEFRSMDDTHKSRSVVNFFHFFDEDMKTDGLNPSPKRLPHNATPTWGHPQKVPRRVASPHPCDTKKRFSEAPPGKTRRRQRTQWPTFATIVVPT